MKCAIRKEIISFSLDLIVNRMGRATIWNGRCLFEWINRISNLTAQIKLLNDLNPKGLVFKAVWGFFDIRIGYFAVRPPVAYRGVLQSRKTQKKHFTGSFETVTSDRPLVLLNGNFDFNSFHFNWKRLRHVAAKLNSCWSSARSEDCPNHEPVSVSVRFLRLSASNIFRSCVDSQTSCLVSPMNSSPFYVSLFKF